MRHESNVTAEGKGATPIHDGPQNRMTEHQIEFKSQHKRITKCFAQHLTSLSGLDLLTLTLTIHTAETDILSTFARAGAVSL